MNWRDQKAVARDVVHDTMRHRAVYVSPDLLTLTQCWIRIHSNFTTGGELVGFDYNPGERYSENPQIIVEAAVVVPERAGFFKVSKIEGYQVDTRKNQDEAYITVMVERLSPGNVLNSLPLPAGDLP